MKVTWDPMAASNAMAEMAGAEGEQPSSLFHISQDYDNSNRSHNPSRSPHIQALHLIPSVYTLI